MAHDHHGHDHHGHDHHGHDHHGHHHDRGMAGLLRYLRNAPRMWRSPVNRAVVELVSPRRGERCLDIGSGFGPGTVLAAGRGAHVVAVDPTPFMRAILRVRRLFQRARRRIEVLDGAAEALPVGDASIDAAWSVNAMHHWVDLDTAVGELARAVRSGGRVVLVDEDFGSADHPDHESWAERRHRHHFDMISVDDVGTALLAAGFASVDARDGRLAGVPAKVVEATR